MPALPVRAWSRRSAFAIVLAFSAALLALSPVGALAQVKQPKTAEQPTFGPKTPLLQTPKPLDQTKPMLLNADELVYDSARSRVTARGNVEIYYNNYVVFAEEVVYDQRSGRLEARGNVRIKTPNEEVISADKYEFSDDFRDGFIEGLRVVTREDARISAQKATRTDGQTTVFENGFFTPCKPCKDDPTKPPLWQIKAQKITHAQAESTIYYEGASFEFLGTTIAYLPYFWSPDSAAKRKSGFLSPEVSHSTDLGFTFRMPYYFALAPNYDFTFDPMETTRHGVLWSGEFRHRTTIGPANGEYNIKFWGIDQSASTLPDSITNRGDLEGWRGSIETHGRFKLSSWWSFGWDATLESDDTFRRFYKIDNALRTDRISDIYLVGLSERNYLGIYGYHFGGLLPSDTSNATSVVHPLIDYNWLAGTPVLGGELKFNANVVSLSRENGADMSRVVTEGKWRKQMIDGIGQVWTPFASVRGDLYQVSDTTVTNPGLEEKNTIWRGMATAGLQYQYPFVAHTAAGAFVLEPIAQLIFRPDAVEQKGIPNEDAKSLVFNETLLFGIDKFSGFDRIETGSRFNAGIQATYQSNLGGYARLLVGQSFQLSSATPFAPGTGLEDKRSDYVAGLYLEPSANFRFIGQARFDNETFETNRVDAASLFNWGPVAATVSYAYQRDLLTVDSVGNQIITSPHEITAGGQLKIADYWYLIGGIRYDLANDRRLQDAIGIKYLDDCFMLTGIYTETLYEDPTIAKDRTFMVRFELKNLGGFGPKPSNTALVPTATNLPIPNLTTPAN